METPFSVFESTLGLDISPPKVEPVNLIADPPVS